MFSCASENIQERESDKKRKYERNYSSDENGFKRNIECRPGNETLIIIPFGGISFKNEFVEPFRKFSFHF